VYYRLKALKEAGVSTTLHCFQYGRKEATELSQVCDHVHYYQRITGWRGLSITKPYIVSSRRSRPLLRNLLSDDAPILFEGVHCCHYLDHPSLRDRFKAVRLHNVEWEYYAQLASAEKRFLKRLYLQTASRRLKRFERILTNAELLLPISPGDTTYYSQTHNNVHYLPAFHSNSEVTSKPGKGDFVLYHGNLSVNENHEAAMFVLKHVFTGERFRAVIAGKEPHPSLLREAQQRPNVIVAANPSTSQMRELICDAQVHILPTFQSTGMKLKLLNTLFAGRWVVTNSAMVEGTGLESLCLVAKDATAMKSDIIRCLGSDFSMDEVNQRIKLLGLFDSSYNAAQLVKLLPA